MMTSDELYKRARAASKRLDNANKELDAAERNYRIAWQEFGDLEDSLVTAKSVGEHE
jgi:outer membrane protein TolC